jgi:hypothetical protein
MNVSDFATNNNCVTAKLTRRDPRMVERKKTGLAKARKRVSPINYFYLNAFSCLQTVRLGQTLKRVGNFVEFLSLQYVSIGTYMWN